MSYLQPISFLEDENLAGLTVLEVVRAAEVVRYPESFDGIATSPITFVEGRGFVRWEATYQSSQFSVKSEDSKEGIIKNQRLPFIIPRNNPLITAILMKAERDELIIKLRDANGQEYLWGSPQKPIKFLFNQETGSGRDRNQYACEFYSEASDNLMIYPATFSEEALPSDCPLVVVRRGTADGPVLAVVPAGSTVVIVSPYSFGYQLIVS